MNEAERLSRSAHARQELAVMGDVFDQLREQLVEKWVATNPQHTATLEKYHLSVQLLEQIRKIMTRIAEDGEVIVKMREVSDLLAPAQQNRV